MCTTTRMMSLPGSHLWPSSLCPAMVGREEGWAWYVGAEGGFLLAPLGASSPRGAGGEGPGVHGSPRSLGLAVLPSLVLVPLHTTPKAVEKELNALYDVFLEVSQQWQSKVGPGSLYRRDKDRVAQRPARWLLCL